MNTFLGVPTLSLCVLFLFYFYFIFFLKRANFWMPTQLQLKPSPGLTTSPGFCDSVSFSSVSPLKMRRALIKQVSTLSQLPVVAAIEKRKGSWLGHAIDRSINRVIVQFWPSNAAMSSQSCRRAPTSAVRSANAKPCWAQVLDNSCCPSAVHEWMIRKKKEKTAKLWGYSINASHQSSELCIGAEQNFVSRRDLIWAS